MMCYMWEFWFQALQQGGSFFVPAPLFELISEAPETFGAFFGLSGSVADP
jgi:hypothetical protein